MAPVFIPTLALSLSAQVIYDCETQFFSWKNLGSECMASIGELRNQKVFLMQDTYMAEFPGSGSEKYRILARDNRFRIQDSNNNVFEFYPLQANKTNIEGKKGNIFLTKIHEPEFRLNITAGGRYISVFPRESEGYQITFESTFIRFWKEQYEFESRWGKYHFKDKLVTLKEFQHVKNQPAKAVPVSTEQQDAIKDKNTCYQEFAFLLPLSKECQKYQTQSVQDTKIYIFEDVVMLDVNAETPYRILAEANATTIVNRNGANMFHPKDVSLTKDLVLFKKLEAEKRAIYWVEVQKEKIYFDTAPSGYLVRFKTAKIYFLNTYPHTLVIDKTHCDIKTTKCITK